MHATSSTPIPAGHTPEGGVVVGKARAPRSMVIFEDPQCPYCRQFEELNGAHVMAAVETDQLVVEYRMRCFLGEESVRADNALALAAEAGYFDELRKALFADQPREGTGGFTTKDLVRFGAQVGLTSPDFVSGVQEERYTQWVVRREERYQSEDPEGTPAARLNGHPVNSAVLFDGDAFEALLRD
jgi:protein-disulfide isomerase